MPRISYERRQQIRSPHEHFINRSRVFMYHYDMVFHPTRMRDVPGDWQNLNKIIGCRYLGWVHLEQRRRGELWSYRSQRHKTLIQLQVPQHQLVWRDEYVSRLQRASKRYHRVRTYFDRDMDPQVNFFRFWE